MKLRKTTLEDSGSGYRGSSPCLPAKFNQINCGQAEIESPVLCALKYLQTSMRVRTIDETLKGWVRRYEVRISDTQTGRKKILPTDHDA
jgi:hypothetical protein